MYLASFSKEEAMYYKTKYISPLGNITLASNGNSLVGLWLEGQKYFCSTVKEEIANIRTLITNADNMLDSSYR